MGSETVGAAVFWQLEKGQEDVEGCGIQNIWQGLYYVNTIVTTIGYGNVYPCTIGGKIVTVIYSFFGTASCVSSAL